MAPHILISNDDGINAVGLKTLERIANAVSDDVWVVAPETNQSGAAHSLTLTRPLRVRRRLAGFARGRAEDLGPVRQREFQRVDHRHRPPRLAFEVVAQRAASIGPQRLNHVRAFSRPWLPTPSPLPPTSSSRPRSAS